MTDSTEVPGVSARPGDSRADPGGRVTVRRARPIRYPGEQIAAGESTGAFDTPPEAHERKAFEDELERIACAEREAAQDADLIHLA